MTANRARYEPMARAIAAAHGVPPDMFAAQIQQESGWNDAAYNAGSGASGLAQIVPSAHPDVDPWNPPVALEYAAAWMAALHDQFGTWALALAAFNAGPGNVQRYGGVPPFPETQRYLTAILGPGWPEPGAEAPVSDNSALVDAWIGAMADLAGTPYVFGGKDVARDGGLDCSGLLTSTARRVGIDLGDPDYTSADGLKQYCDPVDEADVRRGDIVLFSQTYGNGGPDYATHVGVWLRPGVMLDTHDGVHETNLYEPYWQQHLLGFWRPRSLAAEDGGEDMARVEELTSLVGYLQGDVATALQDALDGARKAKTTAQRQAAYAALQAALNTLRTAGQ